MTVRAVQNLMADRAFRAYVRRAHAGIRKEIRRRERANRWDDGTIRISARLPPINPRAFEAVLFTGLNFPKNDIDKSFVRPTNVGGFGIGSFITKWTLELLSVYFEEIREIVCADAPGGRKARAASASANGVAMGLAAWIGGKFGFANPVAMAAAASIMLIIADATRRTFCKMTKKEAIEEIKQAELEGRGFKRRRAAKSAPAKKSRN
jgi:hypothetical protein